METIYFKDIFPDYTAFESFMSRDTDVLPDATTPSIYRKLMARFATSQIAYDTRDQFQRHFGLTFSDCYRQYLFRLEVIEAEYAMTLEDLKIASVAITNTSANNSSAPPEGAPFAPLPYIDYQNSGISYTGKLKAFSDAIQSISDMWLYEFLGRFESHFYRVYVPEINLFYRGEQDDDRN